MHIHVYTEQSMVVVFAARCYEQARPMPSCGVCPCVCLSLTFVNSVETNEHIFEFFSPSGSHTMLVIQVG